MATFHFSIIKSLVSYYSSREQLNCLTKSPSALYRFQLYCNLFGVGHCKSPTRRLEFRDDDIVRLYLDVFEPWEVEEMACIFVFVTVQRRTPECTKEFKT